MPSGGRLGHGGFDEVGNDSRASGRGGIGITVALSELTRASLGSALFLQPEQPRQVPYTVLVALWLIAVAAILAVGVAVAIRWPAAAALAFRTGYAAGVAWARLRSFGTWLLYGVKRMIE